jgi:hypothetical protein
MAKLHAVEEEELSMSEAARRVTLEGDDDDWAVARAECCTTRVLDMLAAHAAHHAPRMRRRRSLEGIK